MLRFGELLAAGRPTSLSTTLASIRFGETNDASRDGEELTKFQPPVPRGTQNPVATAAVDHG
jgi:hypothetical protein